MFSRNIWQSNRRSGKLNCGASGSEGGSHISKQSLLRFELASDLAVIYAPSCNLSSYSLFRITLIDNDNECTLAVECTKNAHSRFLFSPLVEFEGFLKSEKMCDLSISLVSFPFNVHNVPPDYDGVCVGECRRSKIGSTTSKSTHPPPLDRKRTRLN